MGVSSGVVIQHTTGLTPGTDYTLSVVAVSGGERSSAVTVDVTTKPASMDVLMSVLCVCVHACVCVWVGGWVGVCVCVCVCVGGCVHCVCIWAYTCVSMYMVACLSVVEGKRLHLFQQNMDSNVIL